MARGHGSIRQILLAKIPSACTIGVAVSGGMDSICLLAGLNEIRKQKKLSLKVLHVNHGLRGAESDQDEEFVRNLAKVCGADFLSKKLSKPPKANIEAWGRDERYNFFDECVKKHKIDWIITAHTANDVAETYLMRLLANKDLGFIEARSNERRLVRPFLQVSREMVEKFVKANGLAWREDSSNSETYYLRNKIRKTIIPFLQHELGQGETLVLSERLAELAEKEQCIHAMAEKLIQTSGLQLEPLGSRSWVSCLRNIINDIDYRCLRLAVVRIAFRSVLHQNLDGGIHGGSKSRSAKARSDTRRTTAKVVSISRVDCKNLLDWIERKVQAVTLPRSRVLRSKAGGLELVGT